MNALRLAVIGAGHLGRIHAKIAAGLEDIELVAVADVNQTSAAAVASEVGTRGVTDWREIASVIDAAVLATPTFTHHAIGCELLNQSISLLVEKPLAPSLAESRDLVALAERHDTVLQVGHVERFNPAFTSVEAELRDPKFIQANRLSGYSFRSTDIGVVLDLMIHDLDLVLALVRSPVRRVEALGVSVLGGHEDIANARITFASGCVAELTASRVSYEMRRSMQVFTTRSHAALDFAAGRATVVRPREDVLRRSLKIDSVSKNDLEHMKTHLFDDVLRKESNDLPPVNAIEQEQRQFADSVRQGTPVAVDGRAGSDAVAVAEMILEAIEEHAWDGHAACRRGPFAMPSLPILDGPEHWNDEHLERRRAG